MKSWHLMKSSYIKSLITLCLLQQLTACFHHKDSPAIAFDPGPVQGTVSLTWVEPTTREDSSTLIPSLEIAGYRVYYGTVVGRLSE